MKITAEPITIAMQTPFRISRGSRTECHVVRVYIEHDGKRAQGECTPYPRYGESSESVLAQIQQASSALEAMFERGGYRSGRAKRSSSVFIDRRGSAKCGRLCALGF